LIERTMLGMGVSPAQIVEHHTRHEEKEEFDRFNHSPKRIALLVDRGVEGWNVPALFACALARKLKSSNNFVLQAASRCLRQVPGNTNPARVYLSLDNRSILDRQLQETFGENIAELNQTKTQSRRATITLRKVDLPTLVVRKKVRSVVPMDAEFEPLQLHRPEDLKPAAMTVVNYNLSDQPGEGGVLRQVRDGGQIEIGEGTIDRFTAAGELARRYYLSPMEIYQELCRLYPHDPDLPLAHLEALASQIEEQTRRYSVQEETVEIALALVKPDGFERQEDADGVETYTAEISYPIDRQALLMRWGEWKQTAGQFGFHYDPYVFDSSPEKSFFIQLLQAIQLHPDELEDIYFTGAISDPQKTDFFVEYRGEDGGWHRYTPDFVIRRKDGRCLIVEIKKTHDREHPVDGENGSKAMATRAWINLNPDQLKYEMILATEGELGYDQLKSTRNFIRKEDDEIGQSTAVKLTKTHK